MGKWALFGGGSPVPIVTGDDITEPSALRLEDPAGSTQWRLSAAGLASQRYGNPVTETYSATIALDGSAPWHRIAGASGTAAAATINCANVPADGTKLEVEITADASGTCTITFGTGFKPSATLVVTASHFGSVYFVSDGTNFKEHSRSAIIAS